MDLGISKCAITLCPNKSKMNQITFKRQIQTANVIYRNQTVPMLHQNTPYVYLGIHHHQRYKHEIPKNDPLKNSHHALPKTLLDYITTSFNITHSHFSSLVACSTQLTKLCSPFPRDKSFGSLGNAFSHRWQE